MAVHLHAVLTEKLPDGSWRAVHEPSGRTAEAASEEQVIEAMQSLLGLNGEGKFVEPQTSDRFEGVAREIAMHLEGPVSDMLALHSGYARLEAYQDAIASIRLGGGCEGCPSSRLTLMDGVKRDLQDKFGEELVLDVFPVLD